MYNRNGISYEKREAMYTFTFDNCEFRVLNICCGEYSVGVSGHQHCKNGYEIHYNAYGKGNLTAEDTQYELGANTMYITGPEVYHKERFDGKEPLFEYCIYIELVKRGEGIFADEFLNRKFWIGNGTERISELFRQICETDKCKSDCVEIEIGALLQLLLCEIVKLYRPFFFISSKAQIKGRIKIVEDEFLYNCHNLTLESLAEKVHLSQRQTERLLKDNFGKNFSKMKRESQIEKSIEYFNQDIPLSEVAELCGFCDSSAYYRAFKSEKGLTPTEYKRKNKM